MRTHCHVDVVLPITLNLLWPRLSLHLCPMLAPMMQSLLQVYSASTTQVGGTTVGIISVLEWPKMTFTRDWRGQRTSANAGDSRGWQGDAVSSHSTVCHSIANHSTVYHSIASCLLVTVLAIVQLCLTLGFVCRACWVVLFAD